MLEPLIFLALGLVLFFFLAHFNSDEAKIARATERLTQRSRGRKLEEKIAAISKQLRKFGEYDFKAGYNFDSAASVIDGLDVRLVVRETYEKKDSGRYVHDRRVFVGGDSQEHLVYRTWEYDGSEGISEVLDTYLVGPWEVAFNRLYEFATSQAAAADEARRKDQMRKLGIR